MPQSSIDYWREREQRQLEANLREENTWAARLNAQLDLLQRMVDQMVADFYQRYATREGISLADAQQRVDKADVDALSEKAKRYVALATQDRANKTNSNASEYFSKMANEEMRLYNAMMRINRLELLKAEIGMETDQSYIGMGDTMNTALTKRTDDELRRQAGILGETVFHNEQDVASIVNASFHNAIWSQRIWSESTALKSNLDILLTQGLIAGDSPYELSRRLRRAFDVSKADADRLMRTELARVQTDAQMESFKRNGYEKFMFIDTEDSRTCQECNHIADQCIAQDGFLVADMEIGVNAPPMHPNCRCSTAAHISQADFEREMMERFGVDMRNDPLASSGESGIISLEDIDAIKPLSATGKKYPVKLPDGNHSRVVPGTTMTGVKVIMGAGTNTALREANRLESVYHIPAAEWQKVRATAHIMYQGQERLSEIHWYQARDNQVEMKVKRFLDES